MLGEGFGTPAERKGVEGVIGEDVYFEYPYLKGNIKLFSESMFEMIEDGKKDLSCGYRCAYELEEGEFDGTPYQVVQRRIRGNHVALVDNGRMGKDVAVLDASEKLTFAIDMKEFSMENDKDKKTGEDEKSLETLYEMVGDMKKGFDALSKDMAGMKKGAGKDEEDPEKKKAEDEDKPKAEDEDKNKDTGEDAGSEVLARLNALEKRNDDLEKENSTLKTAMDSAPSHGTIMQTMRERDSLAGRLSRVVGSFDASAMDTAGDVAKYGIKQLGIACDDGNELVALDAYLQASPAQQIPVHTATDSEDSDGVDAYINS